MTKVLDDGMQEWLDYKCHYLKGCLESIKICPQLFETYLPSMMESLRLMRNLIGYPDREMGE